MPEPIQENDPDTIPDFPGITRSEATDLADLQFHWDEAYKVTFDGRIWRAAFRGPGAAELESDASNDLRDLIRADYAARQRAAGGDCTGRTGAAPDELPGATVADRSDG